MTYMIKKKEKKVSCAGLRGKGVFSLGCGEETPSEPVIRERIFAVLRLTMHVGRGGSCVTVKLH